MGPTWSILHINHHVMVWSGEVVITYNLPRTSDHQRMNILGDLRGSFIATAVSKL